ncbi:MAG: YfhO family protein, partial [Oscillospiraceae bacterium]|nr:YfhO family protein [Oscillospiraceae bacterium]
MKLPQIRKRKWNYTLLAFLLPVLGMFTLMIIRGFIPFGRVSMLYSDMYHQYYPFFAAFRRALINGD